jgi:hypothetical protein
VPGA